MTYDLSAALTEARNALRGIAHRILVSNGPAAQVLEQAAVAADLALSSAEAHKRKETFGSGGGGGGRVFADDSIGPRSGPASGGGAIDPATLPGGSKSAGSLETYTIKATAIPKVTDDMVERAAEAAWGRMNHEIPWKRANASARENYTSTVRLALEAVVGEIASAATPWPTPAPVSDHHKPQISREAVEVGCRAAYDAQISADRRYPIKFDQIGDGGKETWRRIIRAALVAAEPHLVHTRQIPRRMRLGSPHRPAPMVLYCPSCHVQHVDEDMFKIEPHRSHLCKGCGHIWRPADFYTVGVEGIKSIGENDSEPPVLGRPGRFPANLDVVAGTIYDGLRAHFGFSHPWIALPSDEREPYAKAVKRAFDQAGLPITQRPAYYFTGESITGAAVAIRARLEPANAFPWDGLNAPAKQRYIDAVHEVLKRATVYEGAVNIAPTPKGAVFGPGQLEAAVATLDAMFNGNENVKGHKTLHGLIDQIAADEGRKAMGRSDVMLSLHGWRLVPRQTTNAMITAGRIASKSEAPGRSHLVGDAWYEAFAGHVWNSMYDSRPPTPLALAVDTALDAWLAYWQMDRSNIDHKHSDAMRKALVAIGVW